MDVGEYVQQVVRQLAAAGTREITLIGGEAFGYAISVYPGEGVKKVNGKELPKK